MFAKVLADSVNKAGVRIVTFHLRYPSAVHPEFLMHRIFSRNGSSTRAIPVSTLVEDVLRDPYIPSGLGYNRAGMVPGDELSEEDRLEVLRIYEEHRNFSILCAKRLEQIRVHKQYANKLIDLHRKIDAVVTSTDFDNFFALRRPGTGARSELHELSDLMMKALKCSHPTRLQDGEWHLPFITERDQTEFPLDKLIAKSTARCARVSYNKHDGTKATLEEDYRLYQSLKNQRHMSPFEHQARAESTIEEWDPYRCGNLMVGWVQHRKLVEP